MPGIRCCRCETCFFAVSVTVAKRSRGVSTSSLPPLSFCEGHCAGLSSGTGCCPLSAGHSGTPRLGPKVCTESPSFLPLPKRSCPFYSWNPTSAGSPRSRDPKMFQHWTRHTSGPFPGVLPLLYRKELRSRESWEVARGWHVGMW